jgi:hypothetical protein
VILRLILTLSLCMAAVIALTTRYVNEDLFGGLAAGRDIARGLILAADHWSFTAPGLPWINQAWLSHLLLYLSYDRLGPSGPLTIKVVLFAACVALALLRCRSLNVKTEASLLALLAGVLAVAPFMALRQENFGLFFLMAFSALVTVEVRSQRSRMIALVAVMALWCNFHGSFMLGIALLGAKAGLASMRSLVAWQRHAGSGSWKEAAAWWLVVAMSIVTCGIANPYGMGNITMPFRQVAASTVTDHSADWLPLWRFQQIDEGLFAGGNAWPYLFFLALIVLGLAVLIAWTWRSPEPTRGVLSSTRADWVMEAGIALVSVVLAVRFGRFVLFSALSLVPTAALILHALLVHVCARHAHTQLASREKRLTVLAGTALCVVMAFVCWRVAVVPYLPGNPCRPARPVLRELMSFDSFSRPLATFMRENGVVDRVLSGWALSPYLMWLVPEIRLFMDTRDQSYYPPQVVTDYFTIMGILPAQGANPLELLDRYRVAAVALSTGPIDFERATSLMQSRKWACVYADPYAMLLVRSDDLRFRSMLERGRLDALRYPDKATRILSEATLSHFLLGKIRPDLVTALKEQCLKDPWPNYYSLICWGTDDPRACFAPATTSFLVSEVNRLSQISPLFSNGAEQITDSLTRLNEILEQNALRCRDAPRARAFEALKESTMARYRHIRQYYLGSCF